MRARITAVEIEGFRAIREPLRLSWLDASQVALGRVILAGPNGSGKTSIMEAILLALGRERLIVRDIPAARRGDHWRVEMPANARIELTCQIGEGEILTILRTAKRWEISSGESMTDDATDVRDYLGRIPVEYFSSWRAPSLPGGLQPTTGGRPLEDTEANRLRRLKQRIINERARRAIARDPLRGEAHDIDWLRRLNEVWSAFHSDDSIIEADIVDAGAEDSLFDLFVFDGPTRRCSIDQISSGELELVTIAGSLLLASFDGILLIDEPELHLHRQWQTQLLDALTAMAPDAQLLIATHADAPWNQAFSFERFFLAPAGDARAGAGAVPTHLAGLLRGGVHPARPGGARCL